MGIGAAEKPLNKRRLWKKAKVMIFLGRKCMAKRRRYLQEEVRKMGKVIANNWCNNKLGSESTRPLCLREYEFSFSNTPRPLTRARQHNYLSCIRSTSFEDEEMYKTRADILQPCNFPAVKECDERDKRYDIEELGRAAVSRSIQVRVDREAEDFIARFRSQIRIERQISLLEYEEMLSRGV